jgi:hypothetical protein
MTTGTIPYPHFKDSESFRMIGVGSPGGWLVGRE